MRTTPMITLQNPLLANAPLNKLALFFLLCVVMLLAGGKAMADNRDSDNKKPSKPPHHEQKGDGSENYGHTMKVLNLNDAQKEAFKNAMKQMHESMVNAEQVQEQIRSIVQSDNYDEKKVRDIIQKNDKAQEENKVKQSKAMNDFYKSLTPEQKTKFKSMQSEMKDRAKGRMKERADKKSGKDDSEN